MGSAMHPDLPKDTYLAEMRFNDAKEFADFIFTLYSREKLSDFVGPGTSEVISRGVDDASYENFPRAFRDLVDWSKFDFYPPKPFDISGDDRAKANFLADHRQVELRSVFNFLNYSDKLGIATPLNFYHMDLEIQSALNWEKGKELEFAKRALVLIIRSPENK